MATNQKRNLAVPILKDILKTEVKMEDAQENVKLLQTVLEVLIELMKTANPLFNLMYNRIAYTGSYYDGLRVKTASEFDLNLIIVPPFKQSDFEVLTNCSPASFAKYHLTVKMEDLSKRPDWQNIKTVMQKFFDGDNYFIPEKIRCWLQGVVASVLTKLPAINGVNTITGAVHGPANTLYITANSGVQLDVDLVPVLEFKWPNWPSNAKQHYKQGVPEESRFWFLVPKPAPSELAGAKEKVSRLWRLHFPAIERHLLHNKGCTKPVIKLMKLLRDQQDWKCLASYYLKTVVMWSVITDKQLDWKESYIDTLFIAILKKLAEHVKNRNLPYLFYPSYNLLYKLESNPIQADNVYGSLTRIIRDIEKDPEMYNKLLKK